MIRSRVARIALAALGLLAPAATLSAQTLLSGDALVSALQRGGFVLVIRHARSPQTPPTRQAADPGNTTLERQLDQEGRQGAAAMGRALRELQIPVGEVLTSPAFRARQTASLADLPNPQAVAELGDNGQSMQRVTDAQAAWLRERVARLPGPANTLLITHSTNIALAFPDWGTVDEGEVVIVGAGRRVVGRIRIDEWPRLSRQVRFVSVREENPKV